MIIVTCRGCNTPIFYPYEAGEEPVGAFDRQECDECGEPVFIQRLSFGEVLTEEEFWKKYPEAKKFALTSGGI